MDRGLLMKINNHNIVSKVKMGNYGRNLAEVTKLAICFIVCMELKKNLKSVIQYSSKKRSQLQLKSWKWVDQKDHVLNKLKLNTQICHERTNINFMLLISFLERYVKKIYWLKLKKIRRDHWFAMVKEV